MHIIYVFVNILSGTSVAPMQSFACPWRVFAFDVRELTP